MRDEERKCLGQNESSSNAVIALDPLKFDLNMLSIAVSFALGVLGS